MNILKQIVKTKTEEVNMSKETVSIEMLKQINQFGRSCLSLSQMLKEEGKPKVIAEFKRKSPSKEAINLDANPSEIAEAYEKGGASAISVLTDEQYFGAQSDDIQIVRATTNLPILRKDFIIDSYQLYEAKAMGADVVLLIAEVLSKPQIIDLISHAHDLGLEVLLEIHSKKQIGKCMSGADIIGVNNRNLETFTTHIDSSLELINFLPGDMPAISESGIHKIEDAQTLFDAGYKGFLIGEYFMQAENPQVAIHEFLNGITVR